MPPEIPTIACFEYPKNGVDDVAFEFHCLNTTSHEFIVTTRSDCAMTVNEETGAAISPGSPPSEHRLAPGETVQIGDVLGWELDGVVAFKVRFTRTDNGCFFQRFYALHDRSHPCRIPGRTEAGQLIESKLFDSEIAMLDRELRQQIRDRNQQQIHSLLARGADADYRDQSGYPPIFLALGRGSEEILRLLLECGGAAVNVLGPNNIAPLHRAADRRSGALALLLAQGAEIDSRTPTGETPLMWAINARRAENAILLLTHGADPSARNRKRESVRGMIVSWGDSEVLSTLDKKLRNRLEPAHDYLEYDNCLYRRFLPNSGEERRLRVTEVYLPALGWAPYQGDAFLVGSEGSRISQEEADRMAAELDDKIPAAPEGKEPGHKNDRVGEEYGNL